jgi:hypothetical protein
VVVRTGWGAANYHDANLITFHRVRGFRAANGAPLPPDLAVEQGEECGRAEPVFSNR